MLLCAYICLHDHLIDAIVAIVLALLLFLKMIHTEFNLLYDSTPLECFHTTDYLPKNQQEKAEKRAEFLKMRFPIDSTTKLDTTKGVNEIENLLKT